MIIQVEHLKHLHYSRIGKLLSIGVNNNFCYCKVPICFLNYINFVYERLAQLSNKLNICYFQRW